MPAYPPVNQGVELFAELLTQLRITGIVKSADFRPRTCRAHCGVVAGVVRSMTAAGPCSTVDFLARRCCRMAVDVAQRHGRRGLPGGSSMALLLAQRPRCSPSAAHLAIDRILARADAHRRRTGDWPTAESGAIPRSGGETWMAIDQALKAGSRGLRTRSSLFKLLLKHRGVRRHVRRGKRA